MNKLTELIRILEQRGHIFAENPQTATDNVRHLSGSHTEKLHRRAQIIDKNHQLRDTLQRHQHHIHIAKRLILLIWFVLGFSTTYGLMKHTQLNFFLILLGALGMNTLMMAIWFVLLFMHKPQNMPFWVNALSQKNTTDQAIVQFYAQQIHTPYFAWRKHAFSHLMAMATLFGMLLAAAFLLLVRQYSFNWESTLLSNQAFTHLVALVAWLPEKLGFAVPNETAIAAGRNLHDTQNARTWGVLLLACILCYGIVPRALAWLWSAWKSKQYAFDLPINLPYYQNIIRQWQQRITDSDHDYQADKIPTIQAVAPSNAHTQFWAVLLDIPHENPNWFKDLLGQDWQNHDVVASRAELAQLNAQLQENAVQLLIGVRAHRVPDRGQIRQLNQLAGNAKHGIIIHLIAPDNPEILAQWHDILRQHQWDWV